jgi:hypothetical protein
MSLLISSLLPLLLRRLHDVTWMQLPLLMLLLLLLLPRDVQLNVAWKYFESAIMRRLVLKEGIRADGRGVADIRPITSRAAVLPRTHGSALFTRGETQVGGTPTAQPAPPAQLRCRQEQLPAVLLCSTVLPTLQP